MLSSVGYIRGRGRQFLVAPSVLSNPLTLSRAQTGGVQSSAIADNGSSVALYGADTPRFTGSAQRLLIEGQRTNSIRNPRCEGAVAGTPGTAPTNWALFGNGAGLSWNVVGSGTENGLPYVDLRLSGTSSSIIQPLIRADQVYPVASVGQAWTYSNYMRVVAGSLTGISNVQQFITEWTSGGAFLNQQLATVSVSAAFNRQAVTFTLAQATVGQAGSQIGFTPQIGVAIDCTFRIAAPQLELGAFTSSPILPPAGTPGASTRGTDLISATLASLGIAASGVCTALWSGLIYETPATAGEQTILNVSDGSNNNRYRLINEIGSGNIGVIRTNAGAQTGAYVTLTPRPTNAIFRCGISIDAAGRCAATYNGGAVAAVTGGPTSGLTVFHLGSALGAAPVFGETARLRILPYSVSDTDLQSLVSALP